MAVCRHVLKIAGALSALLTVTTFAKSDLIFVSNERSGDVSLIDAEKQVVISTVPIGKRPRGIHVSPDGKHVYVALSGSPRLGPGADPERARDVKADKSADGIAVLDSASLRVLRKLSVGSDPEQFALSRDGQALFVSNEDEAAASCWEVDSGREVFRAAVSDEPEGVAVHPQRDDVYVTCEERGEVFVLDARSGAVRAKLNVGGRPRTIAFSPDGTRAYIPIEGKTEVAVIDTANHRALKPVPLEGKGIMPMGSVVSPDGRELYVTTGRGNTVVVIDTTTNQQVASIAVGQRPWGIALNSDATRLYTANGVSDDVSIIDVRARKEITRIKVGAGPWGVAILAGNPR